MLVSIQNIIYSTIDNIVSDEEFVLYLKEIDDSYIWSDCITLRLSKDKINFDIIKQWDILASLCHRKMVIEEWDDKDVFIYFKNLLDKDITEFIKSYNKGVIYCRYSGEIEEDYINTEHSKLEISFHPELLQTKEGQLYKINLNSNKTLLYNPLFFFNGNIIYTKDKLLTKIVFEKWDMIDILEVDSKKYQRNYMKYL